MILCSQCASLNFFKNLFPTAFMQEIKIYFPVRESSVHKYKKITTFYILKVTTARIYDFCHISSLKITSACGAHYLVTQLSINNRLS